MGELRHKDTYEKIILNRKGLRDNRDALDDLKPLEIRFAAKGRQLLLERLLDLGEGAELFEALAGQAVVVCPDLERLGIRDHNTDQGRLERVTVHEDLRHEIVLGEDGLDLLVGRQKKRVLLEISDEGMSFNKTKQILGYTPSLGQCTLLVPT